jgi:16S rRNA (cytosine967-C5)-methyltransferase
MSSPADTARAAAWEILQRVEEGAFADALLGHELGKRQLERRDQALVTRIVYGTLAWQGYLDYLLRSFTRRDASTLEMQIRVLLRMGLFQIVKLTRVPPFAVVDTTVELSKLHRHGSATGLVNAVLRRAAREWQKVALPARETALAEHLSIRFSHPRWLVELWVAELGADEAEALLAANNEEAPTVLRVNLHRQTRAGAVEELRQAGFDAVPASRSPAGLRIVPGGFPTGVPGYAEGRVSLQGEASQLVALMVGARPGDRVLDACAAPGGKATAIAELMADTGTVHALDVSEAGVRRIAAMGRRLGLSNVRASVADATDWQPPPAERDGFDCVLVDAPCTGLGTLRQHPEVRWRRSAADVTRAADLQRRILIHMAEFVRPGGALVYATCTLTREENEAVVTALLSSTDGFVVDDPRPLLPEAAHGLVGADGFLRTVPHRHDLDGFFAARLKRRTAPAIVRP